MPVNKNDITALLGGDLANNPIFLQAVQEKFNELVGTSSGYLEGLPQQIQDRIAVLRHLQYKKDDLDEEFNNELKQLEAKYNAMYQPLFDQRTSIVTGAVDPTPEAIESAKKEAKEREDDGEEEQEGAEKKEAPPKTEEKGVPEFWLTTLQHAEEFEELITEEDAEALKYLRDVQFRDIEGGPSFELEFFFDENPFFTNSSLKKSYILEDNPSRGPMYDHIEPAIIQWKDGKNLVTEKVTKTIPGKVMRGGKKGASRKETQEVEKASFFHFFNPRVTSEEEERYEEVMGADYDLGVTLKKEIIPNAYYYFTGENSLQAEEFGMEGGEEEGEEEEADGDDEEYNSDEDADFDPASAPPAQECKQQ